MVDLLLFRMAGNQMNDYVFSSHVYLGFRRMEDASTIVLNALATILDQILDSSYQIEIEEFLELLRGQSNLESLIIAQVIDAIEICFNGEIGYIKFHYFHNPDDEDTQDLSLLEMVSTSVDKVSIKLLSKDIKLANKLGFQLDKKVSTQHIQITFAEKMIIDEKEIDSENAGRVIEKANDDVLEKIDLDDVIEFDREGE